jgi:hypothetical protein
VHRKVSASTVTQNEHTEIPIHYASLYALRGKNVKITKSDLPKLFVATLSSHGNSVTALCFN